MKCLHCWSWLSLEEIMKECNFRQELLNSAPALIHSTTRKISGWYVCQGGFLQVHLPGDGSPWAWQSNSSTVSLAQKAFSGHCLPKEQEFMVAPLSVKSNARKFSSQTSTSWGSWPVTVNLVSTSGWSLRSSSKSPSLVKACCGVADYSCLKHLQLFQSVRK